MKTITLTIDELTEAKLNVQRVELKQAQQMQAERQRPYAEKLGGKLELIEPTIEDAAIYAMKQGLCDRMMAPLVPFNQTLCPAHGYQETIDPSIVGK